MVVRALKELNTGKDLCHEEMQEKDVWYSIEIEVYVPQMVKLRHDIVAPSTNSPITGSLRPVEDNRPS